MRISVTDPIEKALNHTKAILFDDFRFRMWLGLGFCAFLNGLFGRFSGGGNFNIPSGSGTTPAPGAPAGTADPFAQLSEWLSGASPGVYLLGITIALAALLLSILLAWLQGRGAFMFLDGVLMNSGAVREPWSRFLYLGNSAFRFHLLMIAIGWALGLPLALIAVARFGFIDRFEALRLPLTILVILLFVLLVFYGIIMLVLEAMLRDFVVPAMYRRNLLVGDAWRVFRNEVLAGRGGTIFLFYLMRILLAFAAGILIMIGACVTCCVGALPYISSVLFLPIHVFFRLYSIYFLEQFGPDWWFFARDTDDMIAGESATPGEFGLTTDPGDGAL